MKRRIAAMFIVMLVLAVTMSMEVLGTTQINNSSQFFKWLGETGTPSYSVSGSYMANYGTYRDYGLIVYGSPLDIPGNELRDGEYRYLGYTFLESQYTNQLFPNDATYGNIPENWDYVNVSGAVESWESLEQSVQKPYMLYTRLIGHGATTLTAADIGIYKARVQSPATWVNTGSIYTYKSNGYYATFSVPPMGMGILTASMTPDTTTISLSPGTNGDRIHLNLTASVNKPKGEVSFIKVIFHLPSGDVVRFFHNTNSIDIVQEVFVQKPSTLPGNVVITATVVSESIFGDKLERNLSGTIEVVEGSSATPGPTPRPPAPTPVTSVTPVPTPTPRPTPVIVPSPTPTPKPDEYLPFRDAMIWGDWNYWGDQVHRFLALEKIHVKVTFIGYVRNAVIRLSPQLESMEYTNSEGYTYYYSEDFFGYNVDFPEDSTVAPEYGAWGLPYAAWDYILPLCDETIGWDGSRKRPPYKMTITLNGRSGESQTVTIDDIDITGNTHELLHPQPLK
ncbi:MAG TPA: hypothetical protein PLH18_08425 [Clostridia bacterium]|nr:hypothetical protein [Clostridia bacterium]